MDLEIKGIPDGIRIGDLQGEAAIVEWVAVAVERYENQKLNAIQEVSEAVKTCQTNIDNFRKQNTLTAKFEKPKEVEEVEKK